MLFHCQAHISLVLLLLLPNRSGAANFPQCLVDVTSCATNPTGQNCAFNISNTTALSVLRTSNGSPIDTVTDPNITETATALSYAGCVEYCGKGQEAFNWPVFLQDCSSWLLPYLALLSQLPFGSKHGTENLMSALLTLGSPTLAGYSLFLTLLNARWLDYKLFSGIEYPSDKVRQSVVRVLIRLQQVPVRVHPGLSAHFESLIVHPNNDDWWSTFEAGLNYSNSWSIPTAVSIIWVVVTYLLTVTESFLNLQDPSAGNARGTGSAWIWLLPIVVSWLVLSPKCDFDRVHDAYKNAIKQAIVPHSTTDASDSGLTIGPPDLGYVAKRKPSGISSPDELRIPPIFNYARSLSWSRTAYLIALYYDTARQKSRNRRVGNDGEVPREWNSDQIIECCTPDSRLGVLWPRGILFNMVLASLMALLLQWGTTSSAVIAAWYTPTIGLGCRSLAYLIFGGISTAVWFLLVLSNVIGYYAHHDRSRPAPVTDATEERLLVHDAEAGTPPSTDSDSSTTDATSKSVHSWRRRGLTTMSLVADLLRWMGKALAIINAVGLFTNSILEFAQVYDNCYCDSSVLTWGNYAYNVIVYDANVIDQAISAWKGALALALVSCAMFVGTIFLLRDSIPS